MLKMGRLAKDPETEKCHLTRPWLLRFEANEIAGSPCSCSEFRCRNREWRVDSRDGIGWIRSLDLHKGDFATLDAQVGGACQASGCFVAQLDSDRHRTGGIRRDPHSDLEIE
ncbi:hypothetical protein AXG93_154s1250 [Marchantia polymorpha subsp. ruderalis]|uniref:Uncharacterized protein n=1 Tax=Marchantia polymorpha subsp. ruderalis TaxID=1480154 RepID=A0A176VK08_MARPO|nr:hypothetical protein AXG93_154s1250 [Marchantia polymorpha subsp. ruderalis]